MTTFVIGWTLLGCRRPPEAPSELNELAGFVFEHFRDEDTLDLAFGIDNLDTWLHGHIDETLDGYTVDDLKESVIDSVMPEREHDLDELGGASVAYLSEHTVRPIADALLLAEQEAVFPKSYDSHDRDYLTDPDCFMPHECDFVDTDNRVEASYPLGIHVSTHSQAQYRWVQYGDPEKWAFLHRTWLVDPAEANVDWVDIHEQLYVGVTVEWEQGSAVRLGTTWIAADILDGVVSEGTALQIMIDSMSGEGEDLDSYLTAR